MPLDNTKLFSALLYDLKRGAFPGLFLFGFAARCEAMALPRRSGSF